MLTMAPMRKVATALAHRSERVRFVALLGLAVAMVCPAACEEQRPKQTAEKRISVQGRLTRVAAIGGETSGWAVALDQPIEVAGQKLNLIEIDSDPKRWSQYEEKTIQATGRIVFRTSVERGRYPILQVDSIKRVAPPG
jgi:hypothetical protein